MANASFESGHHPSTYNVTPQLVFSDRGDVISAGNFHGEYPAKAADYLAIGIHELAAMSERRIERLVNPGNGAT